MKKAVPVGCVDRGKAMIRVVIVQWHTYPCGDPHDASLVNEVGASRVVSDISGTLLATIDRE